MSNDTTSSKHPPKRHYTVNKWEVKANYPQIIHSHHVRIGRTEGEDALGNAERIVACVNACSGISTNDLLAKGVALMTASPGKETISREPHDQDAWLCICGNTPYSEGFYECDENGTDMEPEIGSDWDGLYRCDRCERIIDMNTLEVVGRTRPS